MLIVSDRQLYIGGIMHPEGMPFEADDITAARLLEDGAARKATPPRIIYETKVTRPSEVGPIQPFRDLPVRDEEPKELVADGDHVLPGADLAKSGASDNRGRGRRSRFGAGR
jgi:hypothetical protein